MAQLSLRLCNGMDWRCCRHSELPGLRPLEVCLTKWESPDMRVCDFGHSSMDTCLGRIIRPIMIEVMIDPFVRSHRGSLIPDGCGARARCGRDGAPSAGQVLSRRRPLSNSSALRHGSSPATVRKCSGPICGRLPATVAMPLFLL
jgi:hypothetical protein